MTSNVGRNSKYKKSQKQEVNTLPFLLKPQKLSHNSVDCIPTSEKATFEFSFPLQL